MKSAFLILCCAVALNLSAAINAELPDRHLDRGGFYFDASLYPAAIDQLAMFELITDATEESEFIRAMASAHNADPEAVILLRQFLTRYPYSTARYRVATTIGITLMDRGHWREAYNTLAAVPDNALDTGTDNTRRLFMAIALIHLGDTTRADNILTSLQGTTVGIEARFYRGYIAYLNRDYTTARSLFEGITDTRAPMSYASYYLSQIYFMQGNNDKALSTARKLTGNKTVPATYRAEASRIAGEALYNTGAPDMAIPYLQSYLDETPGEPLPSAMYILGMSRYRTGDYRGAIEAMKSPSSLNDVMAQSALLTTGQAYMYLGDVSSAAISFNKAVELDIDATITEEAYYNYCVARCDGGHLPFNSSVTMFEEFLKRFPDSRYTPQVAEYLAYGYMNDDNYDAALKSIESIHNPSPKIVAAKQQVLYTLGARDLAAGKYNSALQYLSKAQAIKSRDLDVANECTLLTADCHYHLGDYSTAATEYRNYLSRASKENVNRSLALYDLGYALFAQQQYSDSRKEFEKLLSSTETLTPAMQADATNRIADCYYAARDIDKAIQHYDKAARIDPSTADYPMYQRAILSGWKGNTSGLIDGLNTMIARFPSSPLVPKALLDIAEAQANDNNINDALVTYRRIEREYAASPYCRQAMLLMGSLQSSTGNPTDAYDTYRRLITRHSPSREASLAARYMQSLAAEQGTLDEFVAFMSSVPNAPAIDPSEIDRATFAAAHTPAAWEAYLNKYPRGESAPQALLLLARDAAASHRPDDALRYSTRLVTEYPDGELVAEGLSIKAESEVSKGLIPEALESYTQLEHRAINTSMLNSSRMGQLKAARDLGQYDKVVETADKLLSSSSLGSGQLNEVSFIKATALSNMSRGSEALEIWQRLAANPSDLTGAKSLYYMAQYYFDSDNKQAAWQAVNTLVDSNTPHSYWLARGYILMSDLYRAQGDTFEADEYLKSLRNNYPGSEPDITIMIDSRLSQSK